MMIRSIKKIPDFTMTKKPKIRDPPQLKSYLIICRYWGGGGLSTIKVLPNPSDKRVTRHGAKFVTHRRVRTRMYADTISGDLT